MGRMSLSRQDLRAQIRVSSAIHYRRTCFIILALHCSHFVPVHVQFSLLHSIIICAANGNIFTIKSKSSQSISIESFDINMDGPPSPSPAPIEVYFLPDTDPGFQSSNYQYTKIFDGDIAGEGNGNVTSLPEFTNPVVIPPGATYSFYITVASFQLGTNLHYNIGSQVGSVVASDANLEIGEGWALAYPFLGYSANRRWNGKFFSSHLK